MVLQRSLPIDLLRGVAFVVLLMVVLFGSAGRWNLPFFWAYVGINVVLAVAGVFVVDPDLQQERWHPAERNTEFWVMLLVGLPCYLGHWIVAGLDVGRFNWSAGISSATQIVGLIILGASWGLVLAAVSVNRFFSPVVRIQTERGHHLVTAGPYQYVRHPGYAGANRGFHQQSSGSWIVVGLCSDDSTGSSGRLADSFRGPVSAERIARLRGIHGSGSVSAPSWSLVIALCSEGWHAHPSNSRCSRRAARAWFELIEAIDVAARG